MVENTVGKGEIARYEQFILFPQCFQKTCTADRACQVTERERERERERGKEREREVERERERERERDTEAL